VGRPPEGEHDPLLFGNSVERLSPIVEANVERLSPIVQSERVE
jgi:hypothetical protein